MLSLDYSNLLFVLGSEPDMKEILNYRAANYNRFRTILNQKVVINNGISDIATLERELHDITENIEEAARKSIPLKEISSIGGVEILQERLLPIETG